MLENEKNIIITQDEISALKKLIMYTKFSCSDVESLQFAGSTAINSLFDKIIEADYLGKYEKEFYSQRNIVNETFLKEKMEGYKNKSINKLSDELLREVFKECIHPFPSE
ncbi:hypothetical protein F6Q07_16735 [Pectobacterium parmentieri]|uniref:hypothetical protein n=1 Tax=Pectobacterium parmentieri TaxID=1905730 RepID=UPI00047372A0|nr:hypothetical protein [Pectobacterium parmentieri]AYG99830.1 hypothetical protein C5E26_02020 [Pectobacterium parmentieri]AYH26068.1 hypothetical protein C5E20_02225 [Pectobacterium parmentieri]AYH30522.1 hypothetical protein C5E19_02015 [Pectobacterium parmentieri]MBI0519768.1 hypothetical protein [Pectobacterium parmentieri]MBI0551684.1 hypothetical protein [Pectobacterium parmentieri]